MRVMRGIRGLHTSKAVTGGMPNQPDFTHAKYMYNLRHKPAGKLKAGIFIFGGTALACAIPFGTVYYQQKKAGIW